MKYLIILTGLIYLIGTITFIYFLNETKNHNLNIKEIKKSIVIIIPKKELISYKNNPEGLFKNYKSSGIGAGFFIDKLGTIQTVSHILAEENIVIYNGIEYETTILENIKEKDLAKLKIEPENNEVTFLPLGKINMENIYSFGIDTKNKKIIYNTGKILNKNSHLLKMTNLIEISNNIKPGFSGGPIINSLGEVIGINYAISKGKKYGIKF